MHLGYFVWTYILGFFLLSSSFTVVNTTWNFKDKNENMHKIVILYIILINRFVKQSNKFVYNRLRHTHWSFSFEELSFEIGVYLRPIFNLNPESCKKNQRALNWEGKKINTAWINASHKFEWIFLLQSSTKKDWRRKQRSSVTKKKKKNFWNM